MIFLDTNVLLYAISPSPDEVAKRRIAEDIVFGGDWCFSPQVMHEFYVNAIRPAPKGAGLVPADASEFLRLLLPDHPCLPLDAELSMEAQRIHQRFRVDWWDAPILAAAQFLGCTHLLSEDFSHGQSYSGVIAVNPFLTQ